VLPTLHKKALSLFASISLFAKTTKGIKLTILRLLFDSFCVCFRFRLSLGLFASICISQKLETLPFVAAVCDDGIRWQSAATLCNGGVPRCLFASIYVSRKLETLPFVAVVCNTMFDDGLWQRY